MPRRLAIPRRRVLPALTVAIAIAATTGVAAAPARMPVLEEQCTWYELPYEQGRPRVVFENDPLCPINTAVHAAVTEAEDWPDFDSTAPGGRITIAVTGNPAET